MLMRELYERPVQISRTSARLSSFFLDKLFAVPGDLMQNLFRFRAANQNRPALARQVESKIFDLLVVFAGTPLIQDRKNLAGRFLHSAIGAEFEKIQSYAMIVFALQFCRTKCQ